jgi:6-phosphogluconolactonase
MARSESLGSRVRKESRWEMMEPEVIVLPDAAAVARAAARRFAELAQEAVTARGRFSAALSGGSTPGALYRLLAEEPHRTQIPWTAVHLFWGDERSVSPDGAGSNYRLAEEALIAHVPIPTDNVHRMHGEWAPEQAARAYDRRLQDFYCGPRPRFDLVLLGLGSDGHTASLFPGSDALHETEKLAVAVEAIYQDRPAQRMTLTLPAINTTRQALFLVTGSSKAGIVQAVLEGPAGRLPAQQVQPTAGQLTWLLDEAAASLLARRHG